MAEPENYDDASGRYSPQPRQHDAASPNRGPVAPGTYNLNGQPLTYDNLEPIGRRTKRDQQPHWYPQPSQPNVPGPPPQRPQHSGPPPQRPHYSGPYPGYPASVGYTRPHQPPPRGLGLPPQPPGYTQPQQVPPGEYGIPPQHRGYGGPPLPPPGYPQQLQRPRKSSGGCFITALLLFITVVGGGLFAFLLAGSLLFPEDNNTSGEEPRTLEEVLPDFADEAEGLGAKLENIHAGISLDWEAGRNYSGVEVDQGQRVTDAPGVFMINTAVQEFYGSGTGFVLSEEGLAVTNYHVVEGSSHVQVTISDTNETYEAIVLGRDASNDVAVLKLMDATDMQVASLSLDPVSLGQETASVGNGGGQGYLTSVVGDVRSTDVSISVEPTQAGMQVSRLHNLIQTTADVRPGYSGGPTVDTHGQIIGMTTATSAGTRSAEVDAFVVPINRVLSVVEQVMTGEETDTVSIGAGGALGIMVVTEANGSVVVQSVEQGSAAEEIGLSQGDVLLSLDGAMIESGAELSTTLRNKNAGDQVQLRWMGADGETRQATATLQEAVIN